MTADSSPETMEAKDNGMSSKLWKVGKTTPQKNSIPHSKKVWEWNKRFSSKQMSTKCVAYGSIQQEMPTDVVKEEKYQIENWIYRKEYQKR